MESVDNLFLYQSKADTERDARPLVEDVVGSLGGVVVC